MKKSVWDLEYKKFLFELETKEPVYVQHYAGSMLRGGFGASLKKVACPFRNKDCESCIVNSRCFYYRVFEMKNTDKNITLPHPYIMEPVFNNSGEKQEIKNFNLVLFDYAFENLPYFILAFLEFGKKGMKKNKIPFEIEKVISGEDVVYHKNSEKILQTLSPDTLNKFRENTPSEVNEIHLIFKTPLRVKIGGKYRDFLDFKDFFKLIMRRFYFMSLAFNLEPVDKQKVDELLKKSESITTAAADLRWVDWTRYSSRQKTKMKLGGIMGNIEFKGELSEFVPYIKAAEVLHVGKNTSFGLGSFKAFVV